MACSLIGQYAAQTAVIINPAIGEDIIFRGSPYFASQTFIQAEKAMSALLIPSFMFSLQFNFSSRST